MLLVAITAMLALAFLVTGRVSVDAALRSVDFDLLLVLFALLVTVEILRASGWLDAAVRNVAGRFRTTRTFAAALVAFSGALAALVTNDVALFVVIPFTVIASRYSELDVETVVILEIVATNLIGCLTPLGNPQNLFIFHQSGMSAAEFMGIMAPFVAWCGVGLACSVGLRPALRVAPVQGQAGRPHYTAAVAGLVCFALVLLEIARVISAWPAAVAALIGWLVFLRKRVDLTIVPLFFFAFVAVEGLRTFELPRPDVYFTSIALSQVISNVPAAVLLAPFTNGEWRELLYGVSAGGCGTIIASLANLLGWRIYVRESNRDPRFFRRLTAVNFAFLAWAAVGGWVLLKAQ